MRTAVVMKTKSLHSAERGTKFVQLLRQGDEIVLRLVYIGAGQQYLDDTTLSAKDAVEIGEAITSLGRGANAEPPARGKKRGAK